MAIQDEVDALVTAARTEDVPLETVVNTVITSFNHAAILGEPPFNPGPYWDTVPGAVGDKMPAQDFIDLRAFCNDTATADQLDPLFRQLASVASNDQQQAFWRYLIRVVRVLKRDNPTLVNL